ncbi:MAG: FAD-binding oxidoreductase [Chitinispirillaceae bacterium]
MKSIQGKEKILEQCPEMLSDESRFSMGVPDEVWFPENSSDLQELIRNAHREKIPVTFSGARTGITGGAVPSDGGLLISFSRMNRILECTSDPGGNPILYCEPGITLESISRFLQNPQDWPQPVEGSEQLSPGRFFYPPDPTEMTAQLGGTVANNASGARSFHFGPTRNHIEALDIILATGDLVKLRRGEKAQKEWELTTETVSRKIPLPSYSWPCVKNASGFFSAPHMEPVDLFIGSEGILGVVCAVEIRLMETPEFLSGLSFFPDRNKAFDFADFLRNQKQLAAIEYFDSSVFDLFRESPSNDLPAIPTHLHCAVYWEYIETDDDSFEERLEEWEDILNECGSSLDDTWSGFEPAESSKLRTFRHAVPELVNSKVAQNKRRHSSMRKIGTDSALPSNQFRNWFDRCMKRMEDKRIQYAVFGHLGDYHLHINMLPGTEKELDDALSLYHDFMVDACKKGGCISAEHGIGKLKSEFLSCMFTSDALNQMKEIKRALDPQGLLNRGNLLQ